MITNSPAKYILHHSLMAAIILFSMAVFPSATMAQTIMLTLPGQFVPPGIVGTFPFTSEYSWVRHKFPGSTGFQSWRFGGGTDGGVIFDEAQGPNQLTDTFTMFNKPSKFYSTASGISIDANQNIDMSNLLFRHGPDTIDIGSGSGFSTIVPLVNDVNALGAGENGWAVDSLGIYNLYYNTRGTCVDCEMLIHMYGNAVVVPLPGGLGLLASGLAALFSTGRYRFFVTKLTGRAT